MKKVLGLLMLVVVGLVLTACWPGEVSVETTFNAKGGGTRVITLDVMDDLLSTDPIINPDDPKEEEGKGPVLNDKHIDGGVKEIGVWLKANAPDFITVTEKTEGYHRYFILTYDFKDFDDFLAKYKTLVNLSDVITWDDFSKDEQPTLKVSGGFKKEVVYEESKDILMASLDWALTGIWNDIYNEADLAGFVNKEDIIQLAGYKVTIGSDEYKLERHYDENAPDGEFTGKVIFVEETDFKATGTLNNTTLLILVIVGGLVVLAAAGFGVKVLLAKKK